MRNYLIILGFIFMVDCASHKDNFKPSYTSGPKALVYKTKADFSQNVPVILSDNKAEIVSYPSPSDIKVGDVFQYPTALKNGYLLDNRGINEHVAFINLTYEQYAAMPAAPALNVMYDMIIDKEPLLEMYDCGNKKAFKNPKEQLNKFIKEGKLSTLFKKIK